MIILQGARKAVNYNKASKLSILENSHISFLLIMKNDLLDSRKKDKKRRKSQETDPQKILLEVNKYKNIRNEGLKAFRYINLLDLSNDSTNQTKKTPTQVH